MRRRQLARLFVIIGGLIVIVLTAALVGPYFVDWSSYRSDFEREATRVLGRKVTVMGTATARLLPFPSVTFTDVRVAGQSPQQPAVTVERFSMDAELAPFLRGELLIFDMRIEKPHVVVGIDPGGTIDWALRPATPFNSRQITLERVTVSDGSVSVTHGASGRTLELTGIDGDISAKSLAGPWRFQGTTEVDGEPVSLDVASGIVGSDGHMRIRIKADPRDYPLAIETDGDARIVNGKAAYTGAFQFHVHPDKASIETAKAAKKPMPVDPYRVNGTFSLDNRRLTADRFRFETGPLDNPYSADGKAYLDLSQKPDFGINATGDQVRFDETVANARAGKLTLGQRIAALKRVIDNLPKPTIPGHVVVDLPAVLAGDTTIRDVRLSAEPAKGGWTVKSLDATLPGRTTLEASGFLGVGNDFGFKGPLLLAVKQPSGFAGWIARDVNDAIRRLPSAGFSADVDLTQARQSFDNLELILGDARFKGSLEAREPADANPSMTVKLDGGKLDVDGLTAFASLFVDEKGRNRLVDGDLDLALKAGPISGEGLSAKTVDTAVRLKQGRLDIDRLSVSGLAGADISATGIVKDFPANPVGNVDATILSSDLGPLVGLLARRFPGNAAIRGLANRASEFEGLLSDARINLVASAAKVSDGQTSIGASANGKAGGSSFTLSLSGNGSRKAPEDGKFSLDASIVNNNAAPVYALIGLPALPLGLAGRVEADLTSRGSLAGGAATDFKLHGDGLDASFNGDVHAQAGAFVATGQTHLDAKDLGPWLMTGGVSLPGMGLGLPMKLSADLDYRDGKARLAHMSGMVAGGRVSGDLQARMKGGQPAISGRLSTDMLDLSIPVAMLIGQQSLQPRPGGWPETPFLSQVVLPFDAALDLSIKTLSAGGLVATNVGMKASLDSNGLHVSGLTGRYDGGALSGLADLKNGGGTGLFSSQFHLSGASIATLLPQTGLLGSADISASLSASGKSVEAMVGALAGSGSVSFHDLAVAHLNPEALKPILAAADAFGHETDAKKALELAMPVARSGTFQAPNGEAAFTVAEGIVHLPPLRLETPKATVNADVSADLNQGTVLADGNILYAAGEDALVGSEPSLGFALSGPLSAFHVSYDAGPLAQFLTQRALEREQARVEAMQAALLEKQRLHREVDYYADVDKVRAAKEEEEREAAEEAARQAAEARQQQAEAADERRSEEERRKSEPALSGGEADDKTARPSRETSKSEPSAKAAPKRSDTPRRDEKLKDLPGVTDFLKQQQKLDFGAVKPSQ